MPNIFTLECSFCGPKYGKFHYNLDDFYKYGEKVLETIYILKNVHE